MFLTIVRHAKSSWDSPNLPDIVRPLNPRGLMAVGSMSEVVSTMKLKADKVLCSAATRALHTAIGFSEVLSVNPATFEIAPQIYYGDVEDIINILQEMNNRFKDVWVFGHEPTLSGLGYEICGFLPEKFPTCGILRIKLAISNWAELFPNCGEKVFFLTPRDFSSK